MKTKILQTIRNNQGDVLTCSFSGRLLAIGSTDKLIRLFTVDQNGDGFSELPQSPLCGHSYAVNYCHFSPLGTFLASCSQDGKAIVWDVRTGKKMCAFEHTSQGSLRICQFSPDSRLLATGSDDETFSMWDVSAKKLVRNLEGHEASVVAMAFSPDSSHLITGSTLGDLRVWDARFGHGRHLALEKEAHDLGVTCCQFSPGIGVFGQSADVGGSCMYLVASGGNDNLVKLWRLTVLVTSEAHLSCYTVMKGHTSNVMCLNFTPSGSLLASGSGDRTVIIWEPIKGTKLHQIDHHQRYVTCCAFSSDGKFLASGSNDKTVAIWRVFGEGEADLDDIKPLIDFEEDVEDGVKVNPGKLVSEWSVDDVCNWLASLKLAEYKEAFTRNKIDGQELLHLNENMLKTSLRIDALGHRNKILRAVKLLRDTSIYYRGGSDEKYANLSGKSIGVNDGELVDEFLCPITHDTMLDPVIASDGYTYERSAITAWIDSGKRTSPMTNAPLVHLDLTPNRMLKMLIQRTLSSSKDH